MKRRKKDNARRDAFINSRFLPIPYLSFSLILICYFFALWYDNFIVNNPIIYPIGRGWPPITIYHYHMPPEFNTDLLMNSMPDIFDKDKENYHFVLEPLFPDFLNMTPLLTDDIDNADFIYLDNLPTFLHINNLTMKERIKITKDYYKYLVKTKLIKRTNLFTVKVFPIETIYLMILNGYKATFDRFFSHNRIVVPYLSNFSEPKAKEFNPSRKYKIFFSGSCIKKRKVIFDVLENIPGALAYKMDRDDPEQIAERIKAVPYLMNQSQFCVIPRGDSPSSKRFYDAVMFGCIPVIISDNMEIAYDKTQINWDKCIIRVPENNVYKLQKILESISVEQYMEMFDYLISVQNYIRFDNGVTPENGFGSLLWELYYYRNDTRKTHFLYYLWERFISFLIYCFMCILDIFV